MRKLILVLGILLAGLVPSVVYAGGCGYSNLRQNYNYNKGYNQSYNQYNQYGYNQYNQYYQPYNYVELLVVQPLQSYDVQPLVEYEKVERVVEVRETQYTRSERLRNVLQQILPVRVEQVILQEKNQYPNNYHYHK